WFCKMRRSPSHLLLTSEVAKLLALPRQTRVNGYAELLPGPYQCLSMVGERYRLLNIYTPRTTVPEIVSELRKRVRKANESPAVRRAILSKDFGFLVLAE